MQPDLIVWPESTTPHECADERRWRRSWPSMAAACSRRARIRDRRHAHSEARLLPDSAILLNPGAKPQIYRKRHLVDLGEPSPSPQPADAGDGQAAHPR